ncbi:hypothetical protein CYFUS_004955 [Cystobacter fuscus]|uniref:Uncharacterized protein n=1 Tax=Cystobacter fuscus TaxID=43 RepID=A0A250J7V9_9BACT|nr:hypothetical protein CYFUS_004955 [Cystobacter fuscus]
MARVSGCGWRAGPWRISWAIRGCRPALVTRDAEDFEESLKGFLSERGDRFESNADSESPERLATEALLSVEGLALVRLAEREGFPLAEDYLHVPSVALEGRAPSLGPNSWRRLE